MYMYMCVHIMILVGSKAVEEFTTIHRNPQASQRPRSKAARNTPENPTHPKRSEHIPTHLKRK